MTKKVNELYDEYRSGKVNRREFMKRLALVTGGTAAAVIILPEFNGAAASARETGAVNLINEFITYPAATGEMKAYLSMPEGNKKLPGVIVIHENRGLVPHIQDVNRRMAMEGLSPWLQTHSHRSAAHQKTRIRVVKCLPSSTGKIR